MENENKKTAAQRLEHIENVLGILDNGFVNLSRNLQSTVNAMTLLSKKVDDNL